MTTPAANTPEDESGTGPVTLGDRTSREGSPGSNQSKPEPMPPSGTHPEPLVPPELGDMNVGAGDPQAPSHPALPATTGTADASAGIPPAGLGGAGTAHRVPGLMGTTPDGEAVETDVDAGAARMAGSIDEVVTGVRLPEAGEA